jgi:hypothetical protein
MDFYQELQLYQKKSAIKFSTTFVEFCRMGHSTKLNVKNKLPLSYKAEAVGGLRFSPF